MSFLNSLDRIRRWQRLGRFFTALLLTLAVGVLLILLLGLADAWSGFETASRFALVTTLLAITALVFLATIALAVSFSRRRGAKLADKLSDSPRQPATSGLALTSGDSDTPLSRFLTDRSLEESTLALSTLPASRLIPWRPITLATAALVLTALPIAILYLSQAKAVTTIAHRLLHPSEDLPPWSPLDFKLDPSQPVTTYGGDLAMTVEITGAALEFPVECLVRRPDSNEVQRLPAFRESDTRYSRTLEALTEQVSVAFACGRARSGWFPVELLLQPKVLAGKVTVTPPAYTELGPQTTPLDSNELAALEGAEIMLELTSNRPLAPSSLVLTPATAPGTVAAPIDIPGKVTGRDTIMFRWTVTRPGNLSATLRDVRGTPAADPLDLTLRAIPDQAPAVDLSSPPRLLLATPSTKIPLAGRAEDDNALAKVQFVRTLLGFRDRARVVAPALHEKQFEFRDALDLATLGVTPGQTLELFLEASDHNPSLLGQGASGISRIQIISEEDYAYRIRAKTTLEEFGRRFQAIAEATRTAREALEAMDEAADLNDAEAAEAARQDAIKAHQQAAELLEKLANDFPAFKVEERLKQLAADSASNAKQNLAALAKFDPKASEGDQRRAIREMLDRLGRNQPELDQLQKDAKTLAEAGKVLEMAAKFQQIYANQKSVTERILTTAKEISKGNDQNRRLLPSLAETQKKNRQALDRFAKDLKERAEAIKDPALAPMRDSALEFLQALAMADPNSVMDLASESARLGQANDAFVSAELARSLLENLMQQPNPFASMCNGQCMKFSIPRPDVNQTMEQMLAGLMCQNPGMSPNQGQGAGGFGMGGSGPTGNAQPGFANLDIPVVGPQRMQFEPASMNAGAGGESGNTRNRGLDEASENEILNPTDLKHATDAAPDLEDIPAAYREAVKDYFTPDN